ncbi:MAG: DUF2797 domain-containing protein [Haloarculaceae archaeon]
MQIVGYDARTSDPAAIRLATDGEIVRETLTAGTDLSYQLGERRCAGTVDGDHHVACDDPSAPYCDAHTDRWPCARCTGECDLPLESCREEHAVYLAAFAPDAFKVGVTRSWRLETRLREQGADRAAHLRTVADGRIARQIEADIATRVGDRVRVPTKIRGLHRRVDERAWRDLLDGFEPLQTFTFADDLDLSERPVRETILSGTVRGVRGRVLVLDTAGTTYAVDLRDLVGFELTDGTADRALQSSLGAFE